MEVLRNLKELPKCKCGGTIVPIISEDIVDPGCHCHHSNTKVTSLIWKCSTCGKTTIDPEKPKGALSPK